MKKSKLISLLAVSALSVGVLAACSSSNTSTSSSSSSSSASTSSSVQASTGATAGTTDFTTLQAGVSAKGAWNSNLTGDINAKGKTLTITGTFVGDNELKRELALYHRDSNHNVTGVYTLTVDAIVVNSPNTRITDGTVVGDVYVNAPGFTAISDDTYADGKVPAKPVLKGNLYFSSQALLTAYQALPAEQQFTLEGGTASVKSTGPDGKALTPVTVSKGAINVSSTGAVTYINNGAGSDVEAGATAGTTDATTLANGLSAKGTWLVATTANVDASGKTLTADGMFMSADTTVGRKLALYNQNANHQVTAVYTLTVGKLIVNSPSFYISNGKVVGDVYVGANASGFYGQQGKDTNGQAVVPEIQGNLYFATQAELTAYQKLPATKQVKVTGTVGVQATPAS